MAEKIASSPLNIISLGKKAFYEQISIQPISQAYCLAEKYMIENLSFEECKEGIDAFIEKRNPNWKS